MESFAHWLEHHMMACPIRDLSGLECPGCGFQRSFIALIRGDIAGVWEHYPPMIPFILTLILLFVVLLTGWKMRHRALLASFCCTVLFIGVNYAVKMIGMS